MCPAFALELENWEGDRLSEVIAQSIAKLASPKILAFRCQWAAFPSLNGSNSSNCAFIDLPCASRVDMYHIAQALKAGVDGIMVVACSEDDCKQEKASVKAKHSVEKLQGRLKPLGLDPRLHFCNVAPRYPERLQKEVEQFTQKIASISAKESAQ
jgi:coenzyme F420-reducing hydrogenase delta subunit